MEGSPPMATALALPGNLRLRQSGLGEALLRLACVSVSLWLCLAMSALPMLEALVPAQRAAYTVLMPDHTLRSFGVEQRGAHLTLRATSVTKRHLVVRAQAYPPGIGFESQTPARVALVYAALVLGGAALTAGRSMRAALTTGIAATLAATAMAVLVPTVVLAGAQWSVAFEPFEELSLPVILLDASDFLRHGGAYALCAVAVAAAVAVGRWCDRRKLR
jgi:hypothetical protein